MSAILLPNSGNTPLELPLVNYIFNWMQLFTCFAAPGTRWFTFPRAVVFRPLGLELCARSEVAPLDGAPVQAATGQHHVSGADGQGLVLNDGGGLPTTLLAVRRCPLCSPGHLEIQ